MKQSGTIVGITGHTGAGRSTFAQTLNKLSGWPVVTMSSLISESANEPNLRQLQNDGDAIRAASGEHALAEIAANTMAEIGATSYIVDGIKNPHEARYLDTHGTFYLVAVQASQEVRWKRYSKQWDSQDPTAFNNIDKRDNEELDQWGNRVGHGQRVADCIALAHAMVWNDGKSKTKRDLEAKCHRFYSLIQNPGSKNPEPEEVRMCQAYAISRRSSCPKRQVGAVIVNSEERVVAEGYNEVPDGQATCTEEGGCYREQLKAEELKTLSSLFQCAECGSGLTTALECEKCGIHYEKKLAPRKNLDYCRAVHAEESAILQVSKHGGMGLDGGTILVTTFPCGLCAKKIITCGIREVIFAEPYNVPEAKTFLEAAKVDVTPFEGFTYRAFQQIYEPKEAQ